MMYEGQQPGQMQRSSRKGAWVALFHIAPPDWGFVLTDFA